MNNDIFEQMIDDVEECNYGPKRKELLDALIKGRKAMLALESLTPGGSEYVGDIKRCVEFVNDLVDRKDKRIVKLIGQSKKAKECT